MKAFYIAFFFILTLASCGNKTVQQLSKRWDCVQIENLQPIDTKFQSREDSVRAVQVEAALKELNWTFSKDGSYTCSIGNRITSSGTYKMADNDKTLICTTANNVNTYAIKSLTDQELQLSNNVNGTEIVMHFRPH